MEQMQKAKITGENTDLTELIETYDKKLVFLNRQLQDGRLHDSPMTERDLEDIFYQLKEVRFQIEVLKKMKELVYGMTGSTLIATESADALRNIVAGATPTGY